MRQPGLKDRASAVILVLGLAVGYVLPITAQEPSPPPKAPEGTTSSPAQDPAGKPLTESMEDMKQAETEEVIVAA